MNLKSTSLVAIALVSLSALCSADEPGGRFWGSPSWQERKEHNERWGRNERWEHLDKASRAALNHIDKAISDMNRALPIYDGKRAEADNLSRLARKEVFEANGKGKDNDRYVRLQDQDGKGRYSEEQIERSQKLMVQAKRQLEGALGDLRHSDGKFDETCEAVRDLHKAIEKINQAVNSFSGR